MITSRRSLLKASSIAAVSGLSGCATATGINPLIPPVGRITRDPKLVTPTAAVMGAAPSSQFSPRDKPTYVAQSNTPPRSLHRGQPVLERHHDGALHVHRPADARP